MAAAVPADHDYSATQVDKRSETFLKALQNQEPDFFSHYQEVLANSARGS